jgi:hypothetical protein
MISTLAQVEQARHRQKGAHLCHFGYDFIEFLSGGTGGTGKNPPIAHARARAVIRFLSFRNIWIIIKNTCSTCDRSGMIDISPVPAACASLFHLCQARG